MKHRKEFAREVRNSNYEKTDTGILFPKQGVVIGGFFEHELTRNGESLGVERDKNLVVDEGLNHILNVVLGATAKVSTWYVDIFNGSGYTPAAADVHTGIEAAAGDFTGYDEATRPEYIDVPSTAESMTNTASPAVFTINTGDTIYGAFISSTSGKSDGTGVLLASSTFTASRAVLSADVLNVTYTLNITST